MKKKTLIIATCLALVVLSFLLQPAYATSNSQDPLTFIVDFIVDLAEAFINFLVLLVESFLAFLAKLFGA